MRYERRPGWWLAAAGAVMVLLLAGCTGPDEFGGGAPGPSPTPSPSPTIEATEEPESTPTEDASPTPEATPEPEPTDTPAVEPTPTMEATPEPEPSPTEPEEPTPIPQPPSAMESLPTVEDLTEGAYTVAADGDRTAEQLARAYTDSTAHLQRLDSWGFQQHVFREFNRNNVESDSPLPNYVLATINVYGSPEQAAEAFQWLEGLQLNLGATAVEAPDLGHQSVALTVPTAQGEATASIYVRVGSRTYVYYGQGNDPLPEVVSIANRVFERLYPDGPPPEEPEPADEDDEEDVDDDSEDDDDSGG